LFPKALFLGRETLRNEANKPLHLVWRLSLIRKTTVGDVCFIRKSGKVLLLRRDKEPLKGKWTGVGGKTEFHEEPLESCIREVKEETGLEVKPELAGIITTINTKKDSKWFLHVYVANSCKGELKQSSEGVLEWVSEEEIYEKDLVAFSRISLPYILNRKRKGLVTGKIIHDGEKVLSCVLREEKRTLLKVPGEAK